MNNLPIHTGASRVGGGSDVWYEVKPLYEHSTGLFIYLPQSVERDGSFVEGDYDPPRPWRKEAIFWKRYFIAFRGRVSGGYVPQAIAEVSTLEDAMHVIDRLTAIWKQWREKPYDDMTPEIYRAVKKICYEAEKLSDFINRSK